MNVYLDNNVLNINEIRKEIVNANTYKDYEKIYNSILNFFLSTTLKLSFKFSILFCSCSYCSVRKNWWGNVTFSTAKICYAFVYARSLW